MKAGVRIFWLLSKWKNIKSVIQGPLPSSRGPYLPRAGALYWLGKVMAEELGGVRKETMGESRRQF